ncbi:MAG: hypothetical protein FWF35_04430 [Elusimicrobia bacterium]|nr:hypothetical protein [Elusimicrobiota bacterium]
MKNSNTGKYKFDAKTGKVIKVSDDIPKTVKQSGDCPHGHVCGGNCHH